MPGDTPRRAGCRVLPAARCAGQTAACAIRFAAAFLSLLFPGLGDAYAGSPQRADRVVDAKQDEHFGAAAIRCGSEADTVSGAKPRAPRYLLMVRLPMATPRTGYA